MTNPQFAHALALAGRHSHFWPGVVAEGEEPSWAEIHTRCKAAFKEAYEEHGNGPWCGGITPEVSEDGTLRHTTMTGRLSWVILPDGHVTLTVDRKDVGVVLICDVYHSRGRGWVATTSTAPGLLRRHFWAWKLALHAVAGAGILPPAEVERAIDITLPDVEDLLDELVECHTTLAAVLDPEKTPDLVNREESTAQHRAWIKRVESCL